MAENNSETSPTGGEVTLNNPLGDNNTDFNKLIGRIINAALGVVGSLALLMFIYGGFTWMLSAGSNEKVTKGKNILIWATVGLIVIFSAYALVKFVLSGILGVSQSQTATEQSCTSPCYMVYDQEVPYCHCP